MSNIVVSQTYSQNGASGAEVTVAYSSALSTNQGALLFVRSYPGSSGVAAAPTAPSGWSYAGGIESTAGAYKVREDLFYRRGDGATTFSVTFTATANVARSLTLCAIDGVYQGDFVTTPVVTAASMGNATTLTASATSASKNNALVIAAVGHGGTFGTGGITWNSGTAILAGSQFGSHAIQSFSVPTPASQTTTATWTTAGNAVLLAAVVGGDNGNLAPSPLVLQQDGVTLIDMTTSTATSGGALSYSIVPITNVTTYAPGVFGITPTASAQTFTIATSESGQGSADSTITVPPAASSNAIRRRSYNGSSWI